MGKNVAYLHCIHQYIWNNK